MTQQPSTLAASAVAAAEPAKPTEQSPPAPAAPTQALAPAQAAPAPAEAPTEAPAAPAAPAALAPVETEAPEDSEAVNKDKKEKKKDKDKKDSRNRGVETMFRVTYNNHIALSQLADNKANMLISLNGAIISALIVILTPRLSSLSWPLTPVLVLVAGCVVSLAFAILGSRPRVGRTPVTLEQVRDNQGNALFFGQFTTMSLEQFQESMRLLTKDDQLLYDALTRQLYLMGQSLLKKYRYLKIAYTLFFFAVALAAVSHGVLLIGFGAGT